MGCIDRGRSRVSAMQKRVARHVATIQEVNATLDPTANGCRIRRQRYSTIERRLLADIDPVRQQMGRVMASFQSGLFVGGGRCDWPRDNLD
jgi:hypothetical protein